MISTLELAKTSSFEADKVSHLLQRCLDEQVQVSLKVGKRRYKAEVLDLQKGVFEIHNTLDRDSVMGELRGRDLVLCLPCEGFLFEGATSLMGLGLVKPFPTLKLAVPQSVHKVEKRHSYRLSHFANETEVLYSTPDFQIGKGALLDISMSGCGIRTDNRSTFDFSALKKDPRVFLDIKIGSDILLRVDAAVVYIGNGKLGCHFIKLPDTAKQTLYRFIVQARKELMFKRMQEEKEHPPPLETPTATTQSKPKCLIVCTENEWLAFLTNLLHRKFEVVSCGFRVQEIREQLAQPRFGAGPQCQEAGANRNAGQPTSLFWRKFEPELSGKLCGSRRCRGDPARLSVAQETRAV